MAKLVSSTYGDALFDLALEENKLDPMKEEVREARQAFVDNEDMIRLLTHPELTRDEKLDFMTSVFAGRVSDELMAFMHIILEKERQSAFVSIFDHFLHRAKEYEGTGTAFVTSAVELTGRQKEAVEKKLLETTSYKAFDIDYRVKPEILGGLVIRIGDRVVDSSLKTQIDRLSRQLMSTDARNV